MNIHTEWCISKFKGASTSKYLKLQLLLYQWLLIILFSFNHL